MPRKLRVEYQGAWHHVLNRGISKRPLFETRSDARYFLSNLARAVRKGEIEVHAYSILSTHYHLLLRSPLGRLSEVMGRVQNLSSRRFNRLRRRDGSLVRGRFFSREVRSDDYRAALVRYIDFNPVKAGMVRTPVEHGLGSAQHYLRGSGPRWLTRSWVECRARQFADRGGKFPLAYIRAFGLPAGSSLEESMEFLEIRIASPARADAFENLVHAAPAQVQAWMQRKAMLADGHRVGLPVCGPMAVEASLAADLLERGNWPVVLSNRIMEGQEICRVGLLRGLCFLPRREVMTRTGLSLARLRRMEDLYRQLLGKDPAFVERASAILSVSIRRSLGTRVS